MRESRIPVGDLRRSKRADVRRKKRKRVGVAERAEGIGDGVPDGTRIRSGRGVVLIGYGCVRRQPSELKVQCAVLNVVKHPKSAAHNEFRIAKSVPGKAETRGEILVIGIHERAVRSSGIVRIEDAFRRVGEHRGLLAREKSENFVVNVVLRNVVVPTKPDVDRQAGQNLPGVLRVQTERAGADSVGCLGILVIVVPKAADEIRLRASGKWRYVAVEIKATVIVIVIMEVQLQASDIVVKC